MADKKGMDKYSLKITAYDFVSLYNIKPILRWPL